LQVLKPSFDLRFPKSKETIIEMMELVEEAARLCYQSEGNMGETFSPEYIRSKIDAGHESVIEHSMISVRVVMDRGVSHETVRHRIASYSQESTRYCNYSNGKFQNEIKVIDIRRGITLDTKMQKLPPEIIELIIAEWLEAMEFAEVKYMRMIALGATPQIARGVLPQSTKTEIMITFDFREWRHFFKMRTPLTAHPQMREIMIPLLAMFKKYFPAIFDDIELPEAA